MHLLLHLFFSDIALALVLAIDPALAFAIALPLALGFALALAFALVFLNIALYFLNIALYIIALNIALDNIILKVECAEYIVYMYILLKTMAVTQF